MDRCEHGTRRLLIGVAAATLAVAACSGGDEVSTVGSTTAADTSTTIDTRASTSTSPDGTTSTSVPLTTEVTTTPPPPTTSPPTTDGATTTPAPTTTAAPTTTLVPTTTVPPVPAPATVIAATDRDLVEIDVETGAIVRTIVPWFEGDGVFRGELHLSRDGSRLFFGEAYEDGWYGCESSVGSVGVVLLATGEIHVLAQGSGFSQSPNGPYSAYMTSGVCVPDPEAPDFWVLTPNDRVVVDDEALGTAVEFTTNAPPTGYDSPGAIDWVMFEDDRHVLVATMAGDLHRVAIDGATIIQDHPVIVDGLDPGRARPVGVTGGSAVLVEDGDEGSTDLVMLELATGTSTRLATSDASMSAALSAGGHLVVSAPASIMVEAGAPVTVLTSDASVYDMDW